LYCQARSCNCVFPPARAQLTQQKILPSCSTPCPMTRQSQCGQTGARAWIAHSKLSNVCRLPATTTSNALSYSFSQTSHLAILKLFRGPTALRRCQVLAANEKLQRLRQVQPLCPVKRWRSAGAIFRRGLRASARAHPVAYRKPHESHAAVGKTFPVARLRACHERKRE